MNCDRGREIADAILYEGYILYPYRPSALKNQQRWTFGSVFPSQYGGDEISTMRTEILLYARPEASLDIVVRFLQPQRRQVQRLTSDLESQLYEPVPALDVDGQSYVSWDEAVEREISICDISLADVASRERSSKFALAAQKRDEAICSSDGAIAGSVTRTSEAVEGLVEISVTTPCDGMLQLRVTITNTTTLPELARCSRTAAQNFAFLSTHTLMYLRNGEFISLLDPPTSLHEAAKGCDNQGTWPVLVGEEGKRDTILSSPIILYDYPKVAPESKGPFFDGAEIDEMLTLRVLTLTDDEKSEMAAADPQTRVMLARCEAMTRAELGDLHGAFRPLEGLERGLSVGCHVRLDPKARGDIFDSALKGKLATIVAIEHDFDGRSHFAVTLTDDPGSDLGAAGFPGHRFYFSRDEIKLVNDGGRQ